MSSSKAVNVPTNEKIKEQDINNKLQVYGIYRGTVYHLLYYIAWTCADYDSQLSQMAKRHQ